MYFVEKHVLHKASGNYLPLKYQLNSLSYTRNNAKIENHNIFIALNEKDKTEKKYMIVKSIYSPLRSESKKKYIVYFRTKTNQMKIFNSFILCFLLKLEVDKVLNSILYLKTYN